jgi:hypothetical protein
MPSAIAERCTILFTTASIAKTLFSGCSYYDATSIDSNIRRFHGQVKADIWQEVERLSLEDAEKFMMN